MPAEADAILGTISAIITLIDATKQIYDAVGDTYGLPAAFRAVSSNLPLVQGVLNKIEAQYSVNQAASASDSSIVVQAVSVCHDNANALKQIFDKVFPGEQASRTERYLAAVRTVKPGRSGKVESLMKEIMEKLQLLQQFSLGDGITGLERRQLASGIEELAKVESSLSAEGKPSVSVNQAGQDAMANTNIGEYQRSFLNFGSSGYVAETQHIYQVRETEAMSSEQPWFVPRQANPRFLGYSQITEHLERRLLPDPSLQIDSRDLVFVLSGMGGVGKSETVLHLLSAREESFRERYWGVFWIDCTNVSTAKAGFKRVSNLCAWPWDDTTGINDTKDRLTSNAHHSLLVLDNCDDASFDYAQYIPHGRKVATVLTSRLSDSNKYSTKDPRGDRCLDFVRFTGLDLAAAIELVLSMAGVAERNAEAEESAEQIIRLVDCHPLAITVAGSLVQQGIYSLSGYAAALTNRLDQSTLLRTQTVQARYKAIYGTFEVSVRALEKQMEGTTSSWNALSLLDILAFMNRQEVHEDIFKRAWNYEDVILNRDNEDDKIHHLSLWHVKHSRAWLHAESTEERTRLFRTARALLCQLSLLTWDRGKNVVSMHSLVHAWAKHRIQKPSDIWKKTASILALSIEERIPRITVSTQVHHHVENLLSYSSTVTDMIDLVEFCRILYVFAAQLFPTGSPKCIEASTILLDHIMAHWKAQTDSEQAIRGMYMLGISYLQDQGQVSKAIPLLEHVVKVKALADDQRYRLVYHSALAKAYVQTGQFSKAAPMLEHLIKDHEALAEDDPIRMESQKTLATAYMETGQFSKAIPVLEHVIKGQEALAEDDQIRLASQGTLATAYMKTRQFSKAAPMLEHVIKGQEALAEDDPIRMEFQKALATAYMKTGQFSKAIPVLEHLVKVHKALAEGDLIQLASHRALVRAYMEIGQVSKAILVLEHFVKVQEALAEDDPCRSAFQKVLAIAYIATLMAEQLEEMSVNSHLRMGLQNEPSSC